MRAVVQRVSEARVEVDGEVVGEIGRGFLVLLGVAEDDSEADAEWLAEKIVNLRVFEDEAEKLNRSLLDVGGAMLVVSQFTLYGDTRRGNRPGFGDAAPAEEAERLYEDFVAALRATLGHERVQTGVFGAMMEVLIRNDGPVTILLEHPFGTSTAQEHDR